MSLDIKISDARRIAKEKKFDMVIVVGMNVDGGGHITTYGNTKKLCKMAGEIGQEDVAGVVFGVSGKLVNKLKEQKKL